MQTCFRDDGHPWRAAGPVQGDPIGRQLLEELSAGRVSAISEKPGREAARSLYATFSLRAGRASAAGHPVLGIETTLSRLGALAPDANVLLFGFSGQKWLFSVFVHETDAAVLGVIRRGRPA